MVVKLFGERTQYCLYVGDDPLSVCSRGQSYSMCYLHLTVSERVVCQDLKASLTLSSSPHSHLHTPLKTSHLPKNDISSSPAGTISCQDEIQVCSRAITVSQHTYGSIRQQQAPGVISLWSCNDILEKWKQDSLNVSVLSSADDLTLHAAVM